MKTILITGASSGIGLACVKKLSDGNKLILSFQKSLGVKKNVKSEVNSNKDVHIFTVDVTSQSQISKMFENLESSNLYPDVLINSAEIRFGIRETRRW